MDILCDGKATNWRYKTSVILRFKLKYFSKIEHFLDNVLMLRQYVWVAFDFNTVIPQHFVVIVISVH